MGFEHYMFSASFPFFRAKPLKNMGELFQIPFVMCEGALLAHTN